MHRLPAMACLIASALTPWSAAAAEDPSPRARAFALVEGVIARISRPDAPMFEGWTRRDELFEVDAARSLHAARDGFQSGDAQALLQTYYDPAAAQHLRRHRLTESLGLERLRDVEAGAGDATATGVPPLPDGASIVLAVWWPIATDRPTALPVWDPEANPPLKNGNDYLSWKRVVAIDPDPARGAGSTTTPLEFVGRSFPGAPRVDLDRFPHTTLDAAMAAGISRDPAARKAAVIALGRTARAGDQLALVALHAIVKQQGRWVWITLWWHDQPERGEFARDRPASLHGAWRNFLLDTVTDDATDTIRACFNPWLEARFPDEGFGGGTASNCIACHRRASYPAVRFLPAVRGKLRDAADPAFAPGQLATDFLWSVARGASRRTPRH